MEQHRLDHPISQEQYHAWLDNPVTQRLFVDFEVALLGSADELGKHKTPQEMSNQCAAYAAERELIQDLLEWKPDEIERGADES